MNQQPNVYSRVCWFDLDGNLVHSRWYPGSQRVKQALILCQLRWPTVKFWTETARNTSMPELTIQDLLG